MTNPVLPPDVLARRSLLPLKPQAPVIAGSFIILVPYDPAQHASALWQVSNGQSFTLGGKACAAYDADALIWRYMPGGPFDSLESFTAYMQAHLDDPARATFTVVHNAAQHPIGVITMMSNVPASLKIELGSIWYSPAAQRTNANLEATYLLLRHAFSLGYRRLEWKCDALNERSRRAALRMGFRFEGVQEHHLIVKDRNRDTAWFRILEHEWPLVRTHLEALLAQPR
jgi:RimJ/RimL family protein N-acetyltransferase